MNNKIKKIGFSFLIFLIGIFLIYSVNARVFNQNNGGAFSSTSTNYQYFRPSFNTFYSNNQIDSYWPILRDMDEGKCEAHQDFLVAIPPLGCQPAVVRSDLLEEQNVPVFCKLDALQVNPLIKVSSIKSINFKGDYPEGVAGISFHPARAAVNTYEALLGSPLLNNIGYVVIVLKRNPKEKDMPRTIKGNLTATIRYDAEEAFGAGRAEFLLPYLNDKDWERDYQAYSFWNGKGFVRLTSVSDNSVTIGLYTDKNKLLQSVKLDKGKTSREIYFPGFYCRAGLKVRFNSIDSSETKVKLRVDGDDIWVAEGSKFLDGKCVVRNLKAITEDTGSVDISCRENPRFNLFLSKNGANISKEVVNVGERVNEPSFSGYSLLYVGELPKEVIGSEGKKTMAILIKSEELSDELISKAVKLVASYSGRRKVVFKSFNSSIVNSLGKKYVKILYNSSNGQFTGFGSKLEDKKLTSTNVKTNFTSLISTINNFSENNLDNEKSKSDKYYSEMALWEGVKSATALNQFKTKSDLLNRLIKEYPSSDSQDYAQRELNLLNNYDLSQSGNSVYINNKYVHISLESFEKVGLDEKNVIFNLFNGKKLGEGDEFCLNGTRKEEKTKCSYLRVEDIGRDKVKITVETYVKSKNKYKDRKTKTLYLKGYGENLFSYDGQNIFVRDINVADEVSVSILPEVDNTKSEANFTFNIGIEKRSIKLSPEKTKDMLKELNKSISKWEDRNEKLGKLVKAWKGACFATSAFMMVSNFVSSLNGEAIAREKVMDKYKLICDDKIATGEYSTRTECYNKLAGDINKDVKRGTGLIKSTNEDLKPRDNEILNDGGIFGGDTVNRTAQKERLAIKWGISKEKAKFMSLEDMREYHYWNGMKNSKLDENGYVDNKLKGIIAPAENRVAMLKASKKDRNTFGIPATSLDNTRRNLIPLQNGEVSKFPDVGALGDNQRWQLVTKNNQKFMVLTEKFQDGNAVKYKVEKVYEVNEPNSFSEIILKNPDTSNTSKQSIQKIAREIKNNYVFVENSCQNEYKNPKVKFYQSSPNKYLPAIIPFDRENGWYVKVSQSKGGTFSDNVKGYQASGAVSYYTICNVGEDGVEQNTLGDDLCQSYSVNTNVDSFGGCPGLKEREVRNLKNNALNAIQQSSQQYNKKEVRIGNDIFDSTLSAAGETGLECQNFMSPEQCKTLFNVCDPVICPSSRCNLGGKYSVSNVVQSGIIGSLLLCLPNSKEGILVPICLTGIHAGLDAYVSILKSEQACLKESLESGRNVGICDEITSVYKCEFFWKQLAPMMEIIVPKTIEYAMGGRSGARGGAEYLSVQSSWQNMQSSIDFFKNSYAKNSFSAFKFRNIQEVGSEFCRASVGTSLPSSAGVIDGLLEPESPTQFYARFEEATLNDVTVPPTSQYKVYYHIFAGKDKGVQYLIYLKNPPESGYYHNNPTVTVKSGYVTRGEQADESLDFSAPAGYKELCVVLDAQTKCGFKSVTSSFAVNYAKDKYVKTQSEDKSIATEKDCVSGTPSMMSLANPNLQSGVENKINPNIEMSGITRVCATDNPSKGVDEQRWKQVGNCGNEKMKCWLDKTSVAEEVRRVRAVEGQTLDDTQKVLSQGAVVKTNREVVSRLVGLKNNINSLNSKNYDSLSKNISEGLDNIFSDGVLNNYKAEALYYKVKLYSKIISLIGKAEVKNEVDRGNDGKGEEEKRVDKNSPGVYIVKKEDTWDSIIRELDLHFDELRELNPIITNWNDLEEGTRLNLPFN